MQCLVCDYCIILCNIANLLFTQAKIGDAQCFGRVAMIWQAHAPGWFNFRGHSLTGHYSTMAEVQIFVVVQKNGLNS